MMFHMIIVRKFLPSIRTQYTLLTFKINRKWKNKKSYKRKFKRQSIHKGSNIVRKPYKKNKSFKMKKRRHKLLQTSNINRQICTNGQLMRVECLIMKPAITREKGGESYNTLTIFVGQSTSFLSPSHGLSSAQGPSSSTLSSILTTTGCGPVETYSSSSTQFCKLYRASIACSLHLKYLSI